MKKIQVFVLLTCFVAVLVVSLIRMTHDKPKFGQHQQLNVVLIENPILKHAQMQDTATFQQRNLTTIPGDEKHIQKTKVKKYEVTYSFVAPFI